MIRRLILPVAVFAGLTFLLFWQFFLRGYIPIPTSFMVSWYEPWKTETTVEGASTIPHKPVVDDAFRHLYPLRVIASNVMHLGKLPLWNPYNASGTPLLAIMHPGYLTPFGLFFLIFSPMTAWTIYLLLQPFVLGIFMYWYMAKLGLSVRGAFFASIVLVLSGFSVVRLEYGEFLYVLAGLPLLLGIVEGIRTNPKRNSIVWTPPIVAIILLSGQPHMIVYILSIYALYALVRLPRRGVLQCAGLSVLGVLMAGIQLVPSLELFHLSTISRQTSVFIFDKFLLPFSHLVTVIIPNYFGNQATYNYFGPHDYVETIAYVGTIPVFFAVFACFRIWRDPVVRFFAILAILSALTTLQWAGAKFFFLLPIPVLSADVPSRVFVVVTFAICVLAGIGITRWEKESASVKARWVWMSGLFIGAVVAITFMHYRNPSMCPPVIPQCRTVSMRTTVVELMGFAVFITSVIFAFRKNGKLWKLLGWVPVIAVFILGFYNAQKFLPFSPRETVFSPIPLVSALKEIAGYHRFTSLGSAEIRSNLMAIHGLYSTDYFDPLHVKRYAELVSYVNTGSTLGGLTRSDVHIQSDATVSGELSERRERLWDMTGTLVKITKKSDGVYVPAIWQDDTWAIAKRPNSLARAYLVTDVRWEADPDLLLAGLFSSDTDIGKTAFVEKSVSGVDAGSVSGGFVTIDSYESDTVVLSTASEANALLVLSDTYYPGWRASVDGSDATVYRVNYAFRGVIVPKGNHQIRFTYNPDSLKFGIALSVLSAMLWVGIVLLRRKKGN